MLNHIVIMGRLTRDPELRYTQANTPVASFSVAVDRDFPNRESGERQTDFIDCVAWRQTGEFVSKYFQKGSMVVVSGRLQLRDWTDRDGNKRRSAEIVAENVYFGESKRRDDGGSAPYTRESGGYGRDSGGYSRDSGGYGRDSGGYSRDSGGYSRDSGAPHQDSYREDSYPASRAEAFAELDKKNDGELPF